MEENDEIKKLLRSIRNALWMIAALLLMGLGFQLADFREKLHLQQSSAFGILGRVHFVCGHDCRDAFRFV